MKSRRSLLALVMSAVFVAGLTLLPQNFDRTAWVAQRLRGQATVSDRVAEFGPRATARWKPFFERAHVAYPPRKVVFLGLKAEKQLEIYAQNSAGQWKWVRAMPIVRASGAIGPKLRAGDYQVPEGFYKIDGLNPNSAYHLAIRIGYPNRFDRDIAEREGRTDLGGDIMIHGSNGSVGCLAMGDEASEDLFVLAAQTGIENVDVWLCPLDFRRAQVPPDLVSHWDWLHALYGNMETSVRLLPTPQP